MQNLEELREKSHYLICGVDEAGRGPLAGPLVVASVVLKINENIAGVKDSKKIKESKRCDLYDKILNNCTKYKIEIIDNKLIDETDILKATMVGMEKCVEAVYEKGMLVLIDGNYFKLASNGQERFDFETIIKGDDKIPAISCASILAKVTRDRIMIEYDEIYPQYNFKKHKGYGTKEHIEMIKKYGICDIHRKTFCKNFIQQSI